MNGTYGTVKPANVNIEKDVDIFYNYKPNRSYENSNDFEKLSASNLMKSNENSKDLPIDGLYNLKLPLSIFGKKGIYTIYIKPKEIRLPIYSVGVLDNYPDVRGIIFQISDFQGDSNLASPNALVGYRVEYYDNENNGNSKYTRIITSSNVCDVFSANGKIRFRLTQRSGEVGNGSLVFCTVTPSTTNTIGSNSLPNIGVAGENVVLANTKFNPVMFEIEMVDHDCETLSYMLEGDQVRNLENGTFTVFNNDKEIYRQYETYTVKTRLGRPLYDIKTNKDVIDPSQSYNNTIGIE